MSKWHINNNNVILQCQAEKYPCPYSDFSSREEAAIALSSRTLEGQRAEYENEISRNASRSRENTLSVDSSAETFSPHGFVSTGYDLNDMYNNEWTSEWVSIDLPAPFPNDDKCLHSFRVVKEPYFSEYMGGLSNTINIVKRNKVTGEEERLFLCDISSISEGTSKKLFSSRPFFTFEPLPGGVMEYVEPGVIANSALRAAQEEVDEARNDVSSGRGSFILLDRDLRLTSEITKPRFTLRNDVGATAHANLKNSLMRGSSVADFMYDNDTIRSYSMEETNCSFSWSDSDIATGGQWSLHYDTRGGRAFLNGTPWCVETYNIESADNECTLFTDPEEAASYINDYIHKSMSAGTDPEDVRYWVTSTMDEVNKAAQAHDSTAKRLDAERKAQEESQAPAPRDNDEFTTSKKGAFSRGMSRLFG